MRLNSYELLILTVLNSRYSVALITSSPLFLGFDFGTSGVRSCVIRSDNSIVHEYSLLWKDINTVSISQYSEVAPDISSSVSTSGISNGANNMDLLSPGQNPMSWISALQICLENIPFDTRRHIARIAVSGTSATALIYDTSFKQVTRGPCMYDYSVVSGEHSEQGKRALDVISKACPPGSAANAATSTLAKLLMWHFIDPIHKNEMLLHQADYIIRDLVQKKNENTEVYCTDWNNCLKLGYDVYKLQYPPWLEKCLQDCKLVKSPEEFLPKVVEPGRCIGKISSAYVKIGFPVECEIVGGTTDSIAAFYASGAKEVGHAVTSLGSTLAIKMLSETPVEDSARGVYSHRVAGGKWLVGGASNVGCRVLRTEGFSNQELVTLSEEIDPNVDSPLEYYPLTKTGERFPVQDPFKQPVLDPKPASRKEYLHGILQGIAAVERDAFAALKELGASPLTDVLTAGGGAMNPTWTAMRQRLLQVPTKEASNADAAFGAALISKIYFENKNGVPF